MLNVIVLIGRLTRDPELRYTSQGTAIVNFGIAVDRGFKSTQEDQQTVDFFNVVCWNRLAEIVAEYMTKGRLVAVQGRLQSRNYERDGQRHTVVEIVAQTVKFLDYDDNHQRGVNSNNPAKKDNFEESRKQYGIPTPPPNSTYIPPNFGDDKDDDLPF